VCCCSYPSNYSLSFRCLPRLPKAAGTSLLSLGCNDGMKCDALRDSPLGGAAAEFTIYLPPSPGVLSFRKLTPLLRSRPISRSKLSPPRLFTKMKGSFLSRYFGFRFFRSVVCIRAGWGRAGCVAAEKKDFTRAGALIRSALSAFTPATAACGVDFAGSQRINSP